MKLTKNISSYEIIPKAQYEAFGSHERSVMRLVDKRIVNANQWLIERFGTMIYNTWYWNGKHDSRGWRPFGDSDGTPLSQHKFGRALDAVPKKVTVTEIHQDIIKHPQAYLDAGFTCFEAIWDAPTWLHGDCRWHDKPGLLFVDYSGNSYSLEEYKTKMEELR